MTSEWPMTFWLFHDFTVISCVLKISHLPTINHRPTKESCGDAASWDCPLIAGLGYSRDLSRLDLAITWISALSLSLLLEHCHSLSSQFVPIVQTPVHQLIQVRRLFLLPIVTRGVSHRPIVPCSPHIFSSWNEDQTEMSIEPHYLRLIISIVLNCLFNLLADRLKDQRLP